VAERVLGMQMEHPIEEVDAEGQKVYEVPYRILINIRQKKITQCLEDGGYERRSNNFGSIQVSARQDLSI
jgi:hypothetical protein